METNYETYQRATFDVISVFSQMLLRCVVPLLVFHLLVKEMSAFVLPNAPRAKRVGSFKLYNALVR